MMRYVPVTGGPSTAETLSVAMWALHRTPSQMQQESTARCFEVITALNGSTWLACETTLTVPVHAAAEIDGIAPILIGAGLDQTAVDAVEVAIIAARGGELNLWQYFPQLFKDVSKTHEEMIAQNLLPPTL